MDELIFVSVTVVQPWPAPPIWSESEGDNCAGLHRVETTLAAVVVAVVELRVLGRDELTVEVGALGPAAGCVTFGLPVEAGESQPSITTPATEIRTIVRRATVLIVLPFGATTTAVPSTVGFAPDPTQFAKGRIWVAPAVPEVPNCCPS